MALSHDRPIAGFKRLTNVAASVDELLAVVRRNPFRVRRRATTGLIVEHLGDCGRGVEGMLTGRAGLHRPAEMFQGCFQQSLALPMSSKAFPLGMKTAHGESPRAVSFRSGDRIRTCDLWVMPEAKGLRVLALSQTGRSAGIDCSGHCTESH